MCLYVFLDVCVCVCVGIRVRCPFHRLDHFIHISCRLSNDNWAIIKTDFFQIWRQVGVRVNRNRVSSKPYTMKRYQQDYIKCFLLQIYVWLCVNLKNITWTDRKRVYFSRVKKNVNLFLLRNQLGYQQFNISFGCHQFIFNQLV